MQSQNQMTSEALDKWAQEAIESANPSPLYTNFRVIRFHIGRRKNQWPAVPILKFALRSGDLG